MYKKIVDKHIKNKVMRFTTYDLQSRLFYMCCLCQY